MDLTKVAVDQRENYKTRERQEELERIWWRDLKISHVFRGKKGRFPEGESNLALRKIGWGDSKIHFVHYVSVCIYQSSIYISLSYTHYTYLYIYFIYIIYRSTYIKVGGGKFQVWEWPAIILTH